MNFCIQSSQSTNVPHSSESLPEMDSPAFVQAAGATRAVRRKSVAQNHYRGGSGGNNSPHDSSPSSPSKPAAVLTALSESAKLRWRASVSGVQGLLAGSSAKLSRKAKSRSPSKIFVSSKASTMSNGSSSSSILNSQEALSSQASTQSSGNDHPYASSNNAGTFKVQNPQLLSPVASPRAGLAASARRRRGSRAEKDFEGPINALLGHISSSQAQGVNHSPSSPDRLAEGTCMRMNLNLYLS